jgi:hypothetical protein
MASEFRGGSMSDEMQTAMPATGSTFEQMTKQQIAIYAKELNNHFRNERKLRVNLSDRDSQLDQRAREVSALNNLLQQQLIEWYKIAKEYREVLESINDMLKQDTGDLPISEELKGMIESVVAGTEEADMESLLGV